MTSCFRKSNSTVIGDTSNVDGPCNIITTSEPFSACCPIKPNNSIGGSANLCLSDFLCWASEPAAGGTGFLTASCTDESYASGECTAHCTDNPVPSVIYNPDTGLWACCSWSYEGGIDCLNPTNETWFAPAPQVLLEAASASSSTTRTATSSTASSTLTSAPTINTSSSIIVSTKTSTLSNPSATSTAASSTSSIPSTSPGLGTVAKAGIGVGVVLGVLFLALAFFLAWRQGRRSKQSQGGGQSFDTVPAHKQELEAERKSWGVGASTYYRNYNRPAVEMHSNHTSELPTNEHMVGGRSGVVELH